MPALTDSSPYLDWSDTIPLITSISDADYEALPAQMLVFLGMNSLGTLTAGNGQVTVQFTGGAGHVYALQSSSYLVHWTTFSTGSPVNGQMCVNVTVSANGAAEFYLSVLVQ